MRAVERMCRRAALQLRMSEGFHPKAKMNFPSALALGIEGHAEVMELDLVDRVSSSEVHERLNAAAPPGLVITAVTQVAAGQPKTRVGSMRYQVVLPDAWVARVTAALKEVTTSSSLWIQRNDRDESVDVLALSLIHI